MSGREGWTAADGKNVRTEVMLVEDSPGDVRLTQEAFREINADIRLHVATDGVEAMSFLSQEGAHAKAPRPDLILLDLNLPRMDGREVLAHIKKDDGPLKTIPTVILTTSQAARLKSGTARQRPSVATRAAGSNRLNRNRIWS